MFSTKNRTLGEKIRLIFAGIGLVLFLALGVYYPYSLIFTAIPMFMLLVVIWSATTPHEEKDSELNDVHRHFMDLKDDI